MSSSLGRALLRPSDQKPIERRAFYRNGRRAFYRNGEVPAQVAGRAAR